MSNLTNYFNSIFSSVGSLLTGMRTSITVYFRKKVTEQYPENRETLVIADRFRGELTMPHDSDNFHKCVGCRICERNCPNDTITIETQMVMNQETAKKQVVLIHYGYDLGSCLFCQLCVNTCPHDAITFDNSFENAVFNRNKLNKTLNKLGSKVKPKPPKVPHTTPAKKTVVAEKPITPKENENNTKETK